MPVMNDNNVIFVFKLHERIYIRLDRLEKFFEIFVSVLGRDPSHELFKRTHLQVVIVAILCYTLVSVVYVILAVFSEACHVPNFAEIKSCEFIAEHKFIHTAHSSFVSDDDFRFVSHDKLLFCFHTQSTCTEY